ncbi:MAG: bifunctional nicotinamidase/pyrazinamidase [Candidatus Latescibacteria bacterium]|nr:bifunctional nicotinamidase/pyrazinamidase [Candidatus Latescibacterota bacterium]
MSFGPGSSRRRDRDHAGGGGIVTARDAALLVVDVQNGFISEERELPVPGGADVLPVINALLKRFPVRIATQDWHPRNHGSFASRHPGKKPFDLGTLGGLPQTLWPDHCVQGTRGAELHPGLDQTLLQAVFRKGYDPEVDSYSGFSDNAGRNPTGLDGALRSRGVKRLYVAGLALDYCVRWSALDARRLLPDVEVFVVLDATRPVDPRTGAEAKRELERAHVRLIQSRDVLGSGT